MKERLQQINWRQVVVALVVGYAVSQGVPPEKAAEIVTALVNMLAPVSQ